jgi:RNA polymerase sigma-70 factor (ECF subfamily)
MESKREKELVRRARIDLQAFGELYNEYHDKIFGYVLKRTASIVMAQDITSEVFLKALENIKRFRWQGVPFSAWLYQIAGHEITNGHRKNKRTQLLLEELERSTIELKTSLEEEKTDAEEQLEKYYDFLAIHKSITSLPVKYQEVIILRFLERKRVKEIAVILGKNEGTIRSLLHRGLEKLRAIIT